jgi:hypothetical protein
MNLKETGWEAWISLTCLKTSDKWPAHVNALMNLRVAQNERKCLTGWGTVSFSKNVLAIITYRLWSMKYEYAALVK